MQFVLSNNSSKRAGGTYYIIEQCSLMGYKVEQGEFGADMKVSLLNDGPFTILLDSQDL